MAQAAAVDVVSIRKLYGSSVALKSISLSVEPGEFITLVGPSGCGKSTLLRIIAGLMPQSSGQVRIGNEAVDHLPPKARDIAMVFQSYALYPHMSVAQNISVPLNVRRLPRAARLPLFGRFIPGVGEIRRGIADAVLQVAKQVEIDALLDRKPAQLSGGQRQRVAVARAIIRDPRVFLMDEPLSNLDARLRVTMRGEISDLHKRLGATFIYVTHDQTEAMTMSSRVAVMMDGEIVQCAGPQELYKNPSDLRVARFIGSPEINVMSIGEAEAAAARPIKRAGSSGGELAQVAFRPEALTLDIGDDALMLTLRLGRHELLGHDVLLYLQTQPAGTPIIARMTAAEFNRVSPQGDTLRLGLPAGMLMGFDAAGRCVALDETGPHGLRAVSDVG